MKAFLHYSDDTSFPLIKTKIIKLKSDYQNSKSTIREIYDFYIKNFFNYQKSKQLFTLKAFHKKHQKTKDYFIKILDLNFSQENILKSLREAEKYISNEILEILESNYNNKFFNVALSDKQTERYEILNLINGIPSILKFFLSHRKYQDVIVEEIIDIFINIQKDIYKELILKDKISNNKMITKCKGFHVDTSNKKIYLFTKFYELSLSNLLNNEKSDTTDDFKYDIFKKILDCTNNIHFDKISNLNLTFENIKITKKLSIKIASFKNAISIDSNNAFLKTIHSKFHFSSLFNCKVNFPPDFYDLNNKLIKSLYNKKDTLSKINSTVAYANPNNFSEIETKKIIFGVDIWSIGIILSYLFSYKKTIFDPKSFYLLDTSKNSKDFELLSISDIEKLDIIDIFYKNEKLFPESLYRNINNKHIFIRSMVVGILRYNINERPTLDEIVAVFSNLIQN